MSEVPRVENWLDDSALSAVAYNEYWNDAEKEKTKGIHPDVDGFDSIEAYFTSLGLVDDLRCCCDHLRQAGHVPTGTGLELAAGLLWFVPLYFREMPIDHIVCVEYSRHRLLDLGPRVLEHYGIDASKVTLALGSFYDLRLPNASMNFAIMCQALHHADDPDAVLKQLYRVLKPGSPVIVIGEPSVTISVRMRVVHSIKYLAQRIAPASLLPVRLRQPKTKNFFVKIPDCFPPDPILGDHYHTRKDYLRMFRRNGFDVTILGRVGAKSVSMIAIRQTY